MNICHILASPILEFYTGKTAKNHVKPTNNGKSLTLKVQDRFISLTLKVQNISKSLTLKVQNI